MTLKVIKTECKKLPDNFVPEFVEALTSHKVFNMVYVISNLQHQQFLLENKVKLTILYVIQIF